MLLWYGTKHSVNHLRVFGSTCHALVPKEKMTKLENRSMKCMLLGYSDEKKGYWLFSNGKFIISRDVFFDETKIQDIEQIENITSHLKKRVTRGKTIHQDQHAWIEKDSTPNMNV